MKLNVEIAKLPSQRRVAELMVAMIAISAEIKSVIFVIFWRTNPADSPTLLEELVPWICWYREGAWERRAETDGEWGAGLRGSG
jgi:hypothetical protein